MTPTRLKVARIGNSRGVRLPADTLDRYQIGQSVIMEERSDGILLRPEGTSPPKLSWEETADEMSAAHEDWSDWNRASADGLNSLPWNERPRRVAESRRTYDAQKRTKR